MKKGRMNEAWKAMKRLRYTEVQAARDLYYAYAQFTEEQKVCRSCLVGSLSSSQVSIANEIVDCPRIDLLFPTLGIVYHSPLPTCDTCSWGGDDCSADVRYQQWVSTMPCTGS